MAFETWLIAPRDPLIVRDGRPFNTTPGAIARSLDFPPPSVTTGGVRSRFVIQQGLTVDARKAQELRTTIAVQGPLLVALDAAGAIGEWWLPIPADTQMTDTGICHRLLPLDSGGFGPHLSDLSAELAPVGPVDSTGSQVMITTKPPDPYPHFWNRTAFERWLTHPQTQPLKASEILPQLKTDQRTHVQIDAASQMAAEGMLFQTRGLQFYGPKQQQFALAVRTDAPLTEEWAGLGGERRLVYWRNVTTPFPEPPADLINTIVTDQHCRIVLLTPAEWQHGFMPQLATLQAQHPVTISVRAVANQRPLVISGWDLAAHAPKPTRRLAPAGTVLFLELTGNPEAIRTWAEDMWLRCISDDEQANRDGFGLAVVGVWNNEYAREV